MMNEALPCGSHPDWRPLPAAAFREPAAATTERSAARSAAIQHEIDRLRARLLHLFAEQDRAAYGRPSTYTPMARLLGDIDNENARGPCPMPDCGRMFATHAEYALHILFVFSRHYGCPHCAHTCEQRAALVTHISRAHPQTYAQLYGGRNVDDSVFVRGGPADTPCFVVLTAAAAAKKGEGDGCEHNATHKKTLTHRGESLYIGAYMDDKC